MELYRAPAKINLTLEILGRRPDDFHEIASVIQAVGLYDELRVAPAEALRFACDRSALAGTENLVVRAARALQNATGCQRGAELRLCKGIPIAAGLGGGSSDAATALVALNRHWRLGLPLAELSRIGATLGSDIPFFLAGPTAVVSGCGERVERLPSPPPGWVVLVRPRQPLSTAAVYGALRPESYSDGSRARRLAADLRQGRAPDWSTALTNGLAATAARLCPAIGAIHSRLRDAGARHVQVSGSGPTVFALCASEAAARRIAAAVGSTREYAVWAVPLHFEGLGTAG